MPKIGWLPYFTILYDHVPVAEYGSSVVPSDTVFMYSALRLSKIRILPLFRVRLSQVVVVDASVINCGYVGLIPTCADVVTKLTPEMTEALIPITLPTTPTTTAERT